MLNKIVRIFGGDSNKKEIERLSQIVERINALEPAYEKLSDSELRECTNRFRARLAAGETLDDVLPQAFAVVREASKRTLGLRHFDVQLIGGMVLHQGAIAEMRTGEGKTLVATLPIYLNALALNPSWVEQAQRRWGDQIEQWQFVPLNGIPVSRGVHLITVNDYLARRDARWMAPIFNMLGLSVGVLQMAARTENGKKAFLVDLERESPIEDQHQLRMVLRREAYLADVTYGTNSEFGFDYLRDNLTLSLEERVQRGHYYAIIDEVDNVLIDEARTPLIISSPASEDVEWFVRMAQVVKQLRPEDYEVSEKDRTVSLTELGETHVEEILGIPLRDPERPEDVTPEQARLLGYLEQALRAQFLFHRNKDYLVMGGKVIIVDEFTGRQMPGRRWSDGLHQAVEAKEGVRVQPENITSATITIQNYFRMYEKLAGMTGTAATEAEEFSKIYKLEVISIPTNLDYQASRPDSELITVEAKDDQGYKYTYYARRDDPERKPVLWKRKDYPDVVFRTEDAKLRAIVREILQYHVLGRPILVGTTSVELSERVSARLSADMITRLAQVLLLRNTWFEQHNQDEMDGFQVKELEFLNRPLDKLQVADMRKLGRELNLSLNAEDPTNIERLLKILNLTKPEYEKYSSTFGERLKNVLRGGIPHQVLNARKHTEESQIIAGAGAYGAVTIATNMAGRGVDIKLGGEISETVLADVHRVLHRAGYPHPYEMSLEERRQALLKMTPQEYGIYEPQVKAFLTYMEDMEKVKSLGGLHVIGSERHEARRIDNQLRGRAARQGDPGSSRFYLSLEDELMRLFGGEQVNALMQRLKIDDAVPLEHGLVGRLIEQSQTRVEGANFDTRKHLLEYDDVLNTQRATIYNQRDRIFVKEDLSEDVIDMLSEEVRRRVPLALEDEEGPWKLLGWLEQIQPTMFLATNGARAVLPSYSMRLLLQHYVPQELSKEESEQVLLNIAEKTFQAEQEHILHAFRQIMIATKEHLQELIEERLEILDNFLSTIGEDDEEQSPRSNRQLLDELSASLRIPIRLTNEQTRLLPEKAYQLRSVIAAQIENTLAAQSIKRLMGSIQRRVEELPPINAEAGTSTNWDEVMNQIFDMVEQLFEERKAQYFDRSNGVIVKEIGEHCSQFESAQLSWDLVVSILVQIAQGSRMVFDRKTHRRVSLRTTRLNYIYHAAQLLQQNSTQQIVEDVLDHLKQIRETMQFTWGYGEMQTVASLTPSHLNERARRGLINALGLEKMEEIQHIPFQALPQDVAVAVIRELGRQAITEAYRDLLLRVISWEWMEYLTKVEALRISIGLEAYGQRDPLVQYKNKASELFRELMTDIRLGVVSAMFTSIRHKSVLSPAQDVKKETRLSAPDEEPQLELEEAGENASSVPASNQQEEAGSRSSKRRRHKKR